MDKSTLIIYDSVSFFSKLIEEKGYKVYSTFRPVNIFERILRKISLGLQIGVPLWYGKWKKEVNKVDTIIVFATKKYDHIQYLADNYPQKKIIVWYWNPVFRCFNPEELNRKNIEYWSFDLEDCKKYNLKNNTTFYFDNIPQYNNSSIAYDVIFLGKDKGRLKQLREIESQFNTLNIRSYFHIVPDKNSSSSEDVKPLSYAEYLHLISKSNVILDFLQNGQFGMTLRPMESIFLKKKMITNDVNVIKEDFYSKNNIFVLGYDNIKDLKDFINTMYVPLDNQIILKYDFCSWVDRFFIDE